MNKRAKTTRQRGSSSHGWGHKKKHRGSGHRGGFGLAGTGARGDSQKAGLLAGSKEILKKMAAVQGRKVKDLISGKAYFGKKGFSSIHKKQQNVLSITYIEENYEKLVSSGLIEKDTFDTTRDYDKILGKGNFTRKIKVICNDISFSAKEKIEAAGGSVEVVKAIDRFEEDSKESKK